MTTPTIRLAVDSAFITFIFNFISFIVTSPGEVNIKFSTQQKTNQVLLKFNKQTKVSINIAIKLKYDILRSIIEKLGELKIRIINTSWTSIDIDRRDEYGTMINYDNPSQEIIIDCFKILDGSNKSGEIDFLLYISPNVTVARLGCIKVELIPNVNNKLKKLILNLLKGIIIEMNFANIELVNIDMKAGE